MNTKILQCIILLLVVQWYTLFAQEETLSTYQVEEVVVDGNAWFRALRQLAGRLSEKYSPGELETFSYGNAQFLQQITCNQHPVQLGREYGWYVTNSFKIKKKKIEDEDYFFHFISEYNARSFRFTSDGDQVLDHNFIQAGDGIKSNQVYDAREKYLPRRLRWIYLYSPCFAPMKYYHYKPIAHHGETYTVHFETDKRYFPKKFPFYSCGTLTFQANPLRLISIQFDEVISVFALFQRSASWTDLETFQQAYREQGMYFFDEQSRIQRAELTMQWLHEEDFGENIRSVKPPRPLPAENQCTVQEWWVSDKENSIPIAELAEKTKAPITSKSILVKPYIVGQSRYDAAALSHVPLPVDIRSSEQYLGRETDIHTQYELMSKDDIESVTEADPMYYGNNKHAYRVFRSLFFKEP